MASDVNSSFQLLRPVCVAIAKNPTVSLISELLHIMRRLPATHLHELQEYLFFPLANVFRLLSKGGEELCEASAAAMRCIAEKSSLTSFDMFSDLVTLLFVSLNPPNAGYFVAKSDECQEEIILCLTALFHGADKRVLLPFYDIRHRLAALGHNVSTLLKYAETASSRRVKLVSLQCLAELSQSSRPCDGDEGAISFRASACFASFLPGIALTLCKIITGDTKVGQMVIATSIDVWTAVVTLVMADTVCPDIDSPQTDATCKLPSTDGCSQRASSCRELAVRRTADWMNSTAQKLDVLLRAIGERATRHPSYHVRLAAARLASRCLERCSRSLKQSMQTLLETLICLVGDEQQVVAKYCQEALLKFGEAADPGAGALLAPMDTTLLSCGRQLSLCEILEDSIFLFAMQLPRLLQQPDDDARLASLRLLHGYLEVLGTRMHGLLNSNAHLSRLSQAFLQVLELDCSTVQLLCEATPSAVTCTPGKSGGVLINDDNERALLAATEEATGDTGSSTNDTPPTNRNEKRLSCRRHEHSKMWQQFKHFDDDRVWKELSSCCHLLGRFGDIAVLADHLLDAMNESCRHEKEAAMILNEILRGYDLSHDVNTSMQEGTVNDLHTTAESRGQLIEGIIREYLTKLVDVANTTSRSITVKSGRHATSVAGGAASRANSAVLFRCILLDGLGVAFKVGGHGSGYLLMDSLYAILDHLSADTLLISQTAYAALDEISHALQYRDVSQLLYCHADYVVNSLALRLRRLGAYPRAPLVLQAVLQNSDAHILPFLEDVILDVLHTVDSSHDAECACVILRVLNTLLASMHQWFCVVVSKNTEVQSLSVREGASQDHGSRTLSPEEIADRFLTYHREKAEATEQATAHISEDSNGVSTEAVSLEEEVKQWAGDQASQADAAPEEEALSTDKPEPPLPLHVSLANKVVERCCHLLSHDSARVRIAAAKAADRGCRLLGDHENVLLPAVHKLWAPLVCRLSDAEPAVILSAFECLRTLAELSRDFIRQRLSKEVLPKLCSFLISQSAVSAKTGRAYTYTTSYRLQRALLVHMGSIVRVVDISSKDLDLLCTSCLPYLSCRQPLQLQQECVRCFKYLAAIDADAVWLKLQLVHCQQVPPPPEPCFKVIKFYGNGSIPCSADFAENIKQVLNVV